LDVFKNDYPQLFDLVIASDVLWARSMVPPLFATVGQLLSFNADAQFQLALTPERGGGLDETVREQAAKWQLHLEVRDLDQHFSMFPYVDHYENRPTCNEVTKLYVFTRQ